MATEPKQPDEANPMRKERVNASVKSNPSIPSRDTTRPGSVSTKHNKQMAHHAPVRRAASKGRGF